MPATRQTPVDRHEQLAPADPRRQTDHRRQGIPSIQPGDQILHAPQSLARRIERRGTS
jgi:hypothetical protein